MNRFNNKVIWITGASGTLGRAIVSLLLKEGATVVGSSRRIDDVELVHERFIPLPLDVSEADRVNDAAHAIVQRCGRIDGLVTCTVASIFGDFLKLSDDDWERVIDAKWMGTVRAVRSALPPMLAQGSGSIVLISGRGGLTPPPNHLPGASANAALNLLAQGLATQYGSDGIRVNAVSPGPIASERLDAMQRAGIGARTALGRPGTAYEVADAVAFLLSDQASHITGTNLVVDGGKPR